MTAYFANCSSADEIKKLYRQLAMDNHPDRGGDTRIMQEINAQYHAALSGKHGTTAVGSDGQEHTYWYNAEVEQGLMDRIDLLLKIGMEDVEILLIGKWLWARGNTRPYKDAIKAIPGFRWHSERKAWYYAGTRHSTYNPNVTLDELGYVYGVRAYGNDRQRSDEKDSAPTFAGALL